MAIAELVMPKLGESIMEATILKWHKQVGDAVQQDETVLDIATDKVDSEVPSTVAGIIVAILFNVNDVVPIGTVIARIDTTPGGSENGTPLTESASEAPPPVEPIIEEAPVTPVAEPEELKSAEEVPYVPQQPVVEEPVPRSTTNRFYSPLVMNIANSEGISLTELENVPGTGNDGRISKKDILQYLADKRAGLIAPKHAAPGTPLEKRSRISPLPKLYLLLHQCLPLLTQAWMQEVLPLFHHPEEYQIRLMLC